MQNGTAEMVDASYWEALVPQGLNPAPSVALPEEMRFDVETARALSKVGDTIDTAGYVGPSSVWMPRLQRATHVDFTQRADVRQECSTGCLDLQSEFTQQQARENTLIDRARRQKREHRRAIEEATLATMDDDGRTMALVSRAMGKLERLLNLSGGYARTVYDDLDEAVDIANRAGERAQQVTTNTRNALENAIAEADLHNWACWMHDVGPLARQALLRELTYRQLLDEAGLAQPYETALVDDDLPPGATACLARSTDMGERGVARSRYAM